MASKSPSPVCKCIARLAGKVGKAPTFNKGDVVKIIVSGVEGVVTGRTKAMGETTYYEVTIKGMRTYLPSYSLSLVPNGVDPFVVFKDKLIEDARQQYRAGKTLYLAGGVAVRVVDGYYHISPTDTIHIQWIEANANHMHKGEGVFYSLDEVAKFLFKIT